MQSISLESVSRIYGRLFALHRVSLELRAGEITAIVGDNGSGKTTLLTILATLDAPSRGRVHYDDVTWQEFADHYRQEVGWVSHDGLIYDELTGRENLTFFADLYGLDATEALVSRWLDRVGLSDDDADRRVSTYSRGMRQRLSVARALLQDPDLLLLDEPMTGLDRQGQADVAELLQELAGRGKIVALSSHDLDLLDRLATQAAILRGGKLAHAQAIDTEGALLDCYREYA